MIIVLFLLSKLHFIDWMEYTWKHENVYNKLYDRAMRKSFLLSDPYGHARIKLHLGVLMLRGLIIILVVKFIR